MPPRKLLFISSWFPDRITRANGDFVKRHAQTAALNNQVAVLFVRHDPLMKGKREITETREGNYTEIIIYFRTLAGPFLRLLMYLKLYIQGYKYVCKSCFEPELVHANILYPVGIIAFIFHILYKKPYVISEHWSAYLSVNNHLIPAWRKMTDRLIVRHASAMLPVTRNMADSLRVLRYNNRYEVVPNVVNTDQFSLADKPAGSSRFIHLSTLNDRVKNISGMLQAVKKLTMKRQDFFLEIIGLEDIAGHIENAEKLGIYGKFVSIEREIEHTEVPARLEESMCLLMFSNFESLPCIIIESLASGIPVISTDVGGIAEYITEKEGILVPRGDIDSLASAMDYMLDNRVKFNRNHLREHAVRHFSPEAVSKQLDTIYQSVLADGKEYN